MHEAAGNLPVTLVRSVIVSLLLLVQACGHSEVLQPRSGLNSAGTDLSGTWTIEGDAAEIARRIDAAIRQTDGVRDTAIIAPRRNGQGRPRNQRVSGGLVYAFFENGRTLKITQTDSGLFVSFDRAVVEEYRFGENREVNVGQATAQRVSGWEQGDYVIETLGRNGMKMTERYRLADGGATLERLVTFRSRRDEAVSVLQRFRRN